MKISYIKTALVISSSLLISCQTTQSQNSPHNFTVSAIGSDHWDVENSEPEGGKLYNMGRSYLAASQYGLAIDAFRRDVRVNGPSAMSLNGLGITYDMLGRYDLSQKYYQQALELEPDLPITYSNLAYSQYKQGAYENAIHLAEAAKELIDVNAPQLDSPELKALAQSNQFLAAETALDKIKKAKAETVDVAEGHVIEKTTDRNWVMVKPKANDLAVFSEPYKSNIAIAKILKRKEEIRVEKSEHQRKEVDTPITVTNQVDAVHEEIELAAGLAEVAPETAPKPINNKNFYVADSNVGFYLVVEDVSYFNGVEDIRKKAVEDVEPVSIFVAAVPLPARKPEFEQIVKDALVAESADALGKTDSFWASLWMNFKPSALVARKEDEEISWYDMPVYMVLNGTGQAEMAKRFSGYIAANGLEVPNIGDAAHYGYDKSMIEFAPAQKERAQRLASLLPVEVELKEEKNLSVMVKLTLGKDLLDMDQEIQYSSKSI